MRAFLCTLGTCKSERDVGVLSVLARGARNVWYPITLLANVILLIPNLRSSSVLFFFLRPKKSKPDSRKNQHYLPAGLENCFANIPIATPPPPSRKHISQSKKSLYIHNLKTRERGAKKSPLTQESGPGNVQKRTRRKRSKRNFHWRAARPPSVFLSQECPSKVFRYFLFLLRTTPRDLLR